MNLVNAIPATCLAIAMLAACGGGAQAPQTGEDRLDPLAERRRLP